MAFSLGSLGSILGGAGQLLGGLGIGKEEPMHPQVQAQIQSGVSLDHARQDFNQKMDLAKQHGLHPLSVLGVPTANFSPAIQFGSDQGIDFAALGAGAGQLAAGAHALSESDKAPVEERSVTSNLQERLLQAQVRRAESQADLAQIDVVNARNNLMGQPGNPPGARTSNDISALQSQVARQSGIPLSYVGGGNAPVEIKQEVLPPHPSKVGHGAATDQAFVTVRDSFGNDASVVNSKVINADMEMGATFNALAKIYGVERAMQITAVLENSGVLGGIGAAIGLGGTALYRYFRDQRADALKRSAKVRKSRSSTRSPLRDSRGRFMKGGD